MKKVLLILLMVTIVQLVWAQNTDEKKAVERAALDYLEGFYEGDTSKLKRAIAPNLLKFGYFKGRNSTTYASEGQMTYKEAVDYALGVKAKGRTREVPPGSVEIYEVAEHIASAKVKAWWGFDYLLLAKHDGKWMIEHVLWQGPGERKRGN
ncbi:nuclear transport factor 2 family protein [Roseivirga sp. E12]|uniref:nuclear transport factor 2 family protein n=1 Tax=Roseivirga sp. E12 TaxID=2819237 RepID=UPI001ABCED13|nr:nuclear transport factor 2 family protein [Roseivirga sp. E12]MBO3699467.1 nuclear transport factor 2 family protein [Roseivirga sp. E12]